MMTREPSITGMSLPDLRIVCVGTSRYLRDTLVRVDVPTYTVDTAKSDLADAAPDAFSPPLRRFWPLASDCGK